MLVDNSIDPISKSRNEIDFPGLKYFATNYKTDPDNEIIKESRLYWSYGLRLSTMHRTFRRSNSISNLSIYPETLSDMEHRLDTVRKRNSLLDTIIDIIL